jgi:hypothetical protein
VRVEPIHRYRAVDGGLAKAAADRKLLTCVFYAMRDGRVRSLAARACVQEAGEQARTRAARDRPQV